MRGGGQDADVPRAARCSGSRCCNPWPNRLDGWSAAACGRRVEPDPGALSLHGDEHGLPIHGALAGASSWRGADRATRRLTGALDFGAHPELLAASRYPHVLELAIRLRVPR